jgi:membrane-associated phospholipid phosphatase
LFLDVNRLVAQSTWAHSVAGFFARPQALLIIVALLLICLVRARLGGFGGSDLDQTAALAWAAIATVLAFAVSLPVVHLVARARPFVALPHVVVLTARPTGFSFPNTHTVIVAAFAAGLWLSRAWFAAAVATLTALFVAFSVVYAGTAYPGDAAAGLVIGAAVCLAVYPLAIGSLTKLVHQVARSAVGAVVGGGRGTRPPASGPAARPEAVGQTGAVRILPRDGTRADGGAEATPV